MDFLSFVVRYGASATVAGATSSGKTTLTGWLLTTIPDDKRIYTIENGSRELDLVKRDENGNLLGELIPIDFAMNAAAYGVKTYTAKTLEELEAALIDSKKQNVSTLIDIKVLPKSMTDGYGAWWHVGIASTSSKEAVNAAYKNKDENLRKARKF